MTFQGRSLDDLPLAAYSRQVAPEEPLEDELDEIETAESDAAGAEPGSASAPRSMAALAKAAAAAQPAAAGRAAGSKARAAAAVESATAAESPPAPPAFTQAAVEVAAIDFPDGPATRRLPFPKLASLPTLPALPTLPTLPTLPEWLANPRAHTRDPRLLMTGVIGVGVLLLVASLLFGGGPSAGGVPTASATTAPVVAATVGPPSGDASVQVSGKLKGSYDLLGASGTGPAAGGKIGATWAGEDGSTLELAGAASSGTRKTDSSFALTLTIQEDGSPVTFTSNGGECTVGMSVQPFSVTGSFVCKKLKSDNGKLTVNVRGTYRT